MFSAVAIVGDWPHEAAGAIRAGRSQAHAAGALVYAAVGPELRQYELDSTGAALSARRSVTLPEDVQAGCVAPSGRYVYVAWSDGTNIKPGSKHGLSVFRVDPVSGALSSDGEPIPLASRPIYVSVDRSARHLLIAYTSPSAVTVHRIAPNGRAGPPISQAPLKLGVYAHQILVAPTGTTAILVSRGNLRAADRAEDPGALDVLGYEDGLLRNRAAIAPNRGSGFHPRYIDFDPYRPWIFVSLSEQNEIGVYKIPADGRWSANLSFEVNSLANPRHIYAGQLAGALHVHPSGNVVYLENRSLGTVEVGGKSVFAGGENDIAVFRVNRTTGEPVLIQNVDTRGMVPGEFAFDPSGKILLLANMKHLWVSKGGALRSVPPSLAIFRIRDDGKLDFVRKYDIESGEHTLFWMGVGPLPGRAHAQHDAAAAISSSNDLQRTYQMDRYAELADRGPARGETIYFYKCFVCHNHYARGGPLLSNLFHHARLAGGGAVNDQTVTALIRAGTATMPGFGHDMKSADIEDLVSYLRSADCCYEAENPPANPQYLAAAHKWPVPSALRGGAHGLVRDAKGRALPGVGVQLIAPNGVRTTVFTEENGKYEFPAMRTGDYLLRVATPLLYGPYRRNDVQVEGDARIGDIVLERVPQAAQGALPGALPPTEWIASQLSGAELLWNLSGSIQEKTAFVRSCGIGCHDLKEVLRNRFDERSWRVIVDWMTSRGSGSVFVVRPARPTLSPDAERVLEWLSRVRGPASRDDPYRPFPRPAGASTDVVITEYELPRRFLSVHEVAGDSKGNIWYTSHRTPYVGMLDPRSGIVKEYEVPGVPDAFPGTYKVAVDRSDIVWLSENWAQRLARLDPATGRFRQMLMEPEARLNAPSPWGDFALAPDGLIWSERDNRAIVKIDPESGEILGSYPLTRNPEPADNLISHDGRFWAGGAPTMGYNTGMILDIHSGRMYETNSGEFSSSAARGGFDSHDNAWFGGHTGSIVEIVNGIDEGAGVHMRAFTPPTPYFPYSQFYSAVPDKNGEIWTAWLHGPGFIRFNPASGTWRVYEMPEPSAFARSTWVDDSTTPVTIWYPDYSLGTLVRIQPRD
jgi:streptogramin lyase/6-phosphogluconolactonase (cycloisomerase 2 family)/mono/diheme cytochrome c family protein